MNWITWCPAFYKKNKAKVYIQWRFSHQAKSLQLSYLSQRTFYLGCWLWGHTKTTRLMIPKSQYLIPFFFPDSKKCPLSYSPLDHYISPLYKYPQQPESWEDFSLTLQWRTATCWESEFSQVSMALQMEQILSRGGACRSGQPKSCTWTIKEKEVLDLRTCLRILREGTSFGSWWVQCPA